MNQSVTIHIREVSKEEQERLVMMPYQQTDMERHNHDFFELVYVVKGTAVHTLNSTEGMLTEGDYFIVDYGSVHSYSRSSDFTLINCIFLPEVIDETLTGCRSLDELLHGCLIRYYTSIPGETPVDRIFHDENGRIKQLIMGMLEEYEEKKEGYAEVFRCRLIELLILTLRKGIHENQKHPKHRAVLDVIQYVDRNYQNYVNLGAFCWQYHYTLSYISRIFRQETGLSFREYLQKVRIEKSCQLLAGSDMRIGEIAQAVGYEDKKFFNSVFKRIVKMTPREYRNLWAAKGSQERK
ncbi:MULTISPECIES: helix-turn-helix domain-containing protein [Blautia]|uniref:helix-turn-helix domain-containing protein n=1 Tax=Blautia TaxID=572511 RepID=UPI000BA44C78|nr:MULTISPECIES: helix-turn-helix domain-containing protein [Blautia]